MISFWARNFLNKDYAAFYFETMNKGFMQKGRPNAIWGRSSLPLLSFLLIRILFSLFIVS